MKRRWRVKAPERPRCSFMAPSPCMHHRLHPPLFSTLPNRHRILSSPIKPTTHHLSLLLSLQPILILSNPILLNIYLISCNTKYHIVISIISLFYWQIYNKIQAIISWINHDGKYWIVKLKSLLLRFVHDVRVRAAWSSSPMSFRESNYQINSHFLKKKKIICWLTDLLLLYI